MSTPTPALDFLRKVDTWEQADGASAGLPVVMPDRERDSLAAILAAVSTAGPSVLLEDRARRWLIGYHELVTQQGGLTSDQQRELDSIVTCIPLWNARQQRDQRRSQPVAYRRLSGLPVWTWVIVLIAVIGSGLSASALLTGSGDGSPPAAGAPVNPAQQPAQGGLTDLQQFRADWNVPAAASPSAGEAVQVVLLQDGLYYPAPWYLPGGGSGWQPDTTGSIAAVFVHGNQADVTDSDGTTWIVATGQPFVLASSPQVVFRVTQDSAVQTMPQPHAIAVRHRI